MDLARAFVLVLLSATAVRAEDIAIALDVDAREAPRRILHAALNVPARPGPMTLVYPKWLPGEHGPTGPIVDLVGLKILAAGRPLPWRRDPQDMFRFQFEVPPGTSALDVSLDFVPPPVAEGFTSGASMTPNVAVLSWNQVLLYPDGAASDAVRVTPRLRLPEGWSFATALRVASKTAESVEFKPVSLTTLVDSPLLAGRHMRTVELASAPPVRLNLAGESPEAVQIGAHYEERYRRLAAEAAALFGAHHFEQYDFLYALSDGVAHFGLEHHESSDNRTRERTFLEDEFRKTMVGLLPHEYVHSWNGKYRRPADLATPDYQKPMKSALLWVYEGLTNYLGDVLTARSGLLTPEQMRERLAHVAAYLDHRPGREWRPLVDTAVAAQVLYSARPDWASLRREVDFYDEGTLLWLEVDTLLRQKSGGAKSLDDFCRTFHGPPGGRPALKTYTLDDVAAALNQVAPHDWKGQLEARVNGTAPRAPLGGIEAGGWRLVYVDEAPDTLKAREEAEKIVDLTTSIGVVAREDGFLKDVVPGLAAARAGIAPAMTVVAVNGRRFTRDVVRAALAAGKGRPEPLELIAQNGDFFTTHRLDYHDGVRWPALERDPSKPDLLSQILAPKASPPAAR